MQRLYFYVDISNIILHLNLVYYQQSSYHGSNRSTWNCKKYIATKDEIEKHIATYLTTLVDRLNKLFDLFRCSIHCLDPKSYKKYPQTELFAATNESWKKITKT